MIRSRNNVWLVLLNNVPLLLFVGLCLTFGLLSDKFLTPQNLVNVLVQSSSVGIVTIGMTFVLLTAGVDLSVGAIMYVSAAVAGKMTLHGASLGSALAVIVLMGLAFGAINGLLITRGKIMPFIVTLATLYLGRGFGLWLTQTRAMNLPESFLQLGAARVIGIPLPVILFGLVLLAAHWVLQRTPFGRQIYAVGKDTEAAHKAGIRVQRLLVMVYIICGCCAAIGGVVALSQLGAVSPTFGNQREFTAIAAAVLGGTSLFGGRGQAFPGAVLGTLLIQTVENGLVILNADPYLYPLITSGIIFIAVWIDCLRHGILLKLGRRKIRATTA